MYIPAAQMIFVAGGGSAGVTMSSYGIKRESKGYI